MTAAAVIQVPPLVWHRRPGPSEIDALAVQFFQQELATAAAYKTAIALDEQLEVIRDRLTLMVEQFGKRNGELKLVGVYHEIVVTFSKVTVDPSMLRADAPVLQIRPRRAR